MVRFMAENCIEKPEEIKKFNRFGYVFREDLSSKIKVYPMSRTFSFLFSKNLDTEF